MRLSSFCLSMSGAAEIVPVAHSITQTIPKACQQFNMADEEKGFFLVCNSKELRT